VTELWCLYYHDSKQHNIENFGTTIKGIAAGQLLHPDHLILYCKGYITGIAVTL
jgi:hypothetical protein